MTTNRETTTTKTSKKIDKIITSAQYIFIGIVMFILFGIIGTYENSYQMKGEIISIIDNEISVRDCTGQEWAFYGDGYKQGDAVKITFYTNGTTKRKDDEIRKVKVIEQETNK